MNFDTHFYNESIEQAGYTLVKRVGATYLLRDNETGAIEQWHRHTTPPASYYIQHKKGYLEFVCTPEVVAI